MSMTVEAVLSLHGMGSLEQLAMVDARIRKGEAKLLEKVTGENECNAK